jgi:hypothetical protein
MKTAYAENQQASIFVKKGKDDLKGRCLMINLVVGDSFWLSSKSVKVTLWEQDEECQNKDEVVSTLLSLAKENKFLNLKVLEEN